MGPVTAIEDRQSSSLRAVTFRLTSTPIHSLPQISSHLAAQLLSCKELLSAGQDAVSKENAALLHSFKTRLSSLLQDRTVEGRWAAVVLLKSTVELGGSELLLGDKERCGAWIRGLIAILHKPDPSSTKKMCIITLTRIFLLTRDHPTLLRELTTPSLPPYITACVNHFQTDDILEKSAQRALLEPVLESFSRLVPRHPTIFRSFQSKIRTIILQVLSRDPHVSGGQVVSTPTRHLRVIAEQLLVQLHQCAQKNGSAEEWNLAVRAVVASVHLTADQIFRAVSEDWESVAGVRSTLEVGQNLPDQPGIDDTDKVGLVEWTGLRSGAQRITTLLELLTQYIVTAGTSAVPLRAGVIVDLLTRLLYMRVPVDRQSVASRFNNQVSRNEREELWSLLPSIHVVAIEAFVALLQRLDTASSACSAQLLDLLPWLFESEKFDGVMRTAVYGAAATILTSSGPSLTKSSVASLESIILACCVDSLPPQKQKELVVSKSNVQNGNKSGQQNGISLENTGTTTTTTSSPTEYSGLHDAAFELLPILLGKLPTQHIPVPARSELDRVAVLSKHSAALTASALNPSPYKPSVLPLMASLCPGTLEAEGILRPRLPVIRTTTREEDALEEANDVEDMEINTLSTLHGTFAAVAPSVSLQESLPTPAPAMNGDSGATIDEQLEHVIITPASAPSVFTASTTSTKRVQEEEEVGFKSSPKRARFETNSADQSISAMATSASESLSVTPYTETTVSHTTTVLPVEKDVVMEQENDDDSDGSDFEIPKLVTHGDSDSDEEE